MRAQGCFDFKLIASDQGTDSSQNKEISSRNPVRDEVPQASKPNRKSSCGPCQST